MELRGKPVARALRSRSISDLWRVSPLCEEELMAIAERPNGHAALMDGVYCHQRHVYDVTRKYYLLGRDRMLAGLDVPPGGGVLELGCGTGRNLLLAARRYRDARFFGLDISTE